MTVIRVFVVDDHDIVREGLISLLGRERDLDVVGQAETAEDALDSIPAVDPDVVVIDQRLPGMTGIELCREIRERQWRSNVVVLSAFLEEDTVEAAFRAGARAYVVKDVESDQLKSAIRAAAEGQMTVDPKVAGRYVEWATRWSAEDARRLSPDETRLLGHFAQGESIAEAAKANGLTVLAAKSILRRIYGKLDVDGRAEAVAVALRRGLL